MMWIVCYWLIICFICTIFMAVIKRYDEEEWQIKGWHRLMICAIGGGNSILINAMAEEQKVTGLLLAIVAGALLFACTTDSISCQVFRFTWWVGLGAAGMIFMLRIERMADCSSLQTILTELLVYILLQEFFFGRFYGRADCHAFVLCALVGTLYGMAFKEYLVHMLLAFFLLAIHQIFRKNISKIGNLKQPVAFLPHITVAFWIIMIKISV